MNFKKILSQLEHYRDLIIGIYPMTIAGILRPMMPHKLLKIAYTVIRFGFTPTSLIAIGAARDPQATAVIDDYGFLSYRELNTTTEKLAQALADRGINPGDPVGILARNHRGFLQLIGAAGRLGIHVVLLNTGASVEQLAAIISEQKLRILLVDDEFIPLLGDNYTATAVVINWPNPERSYSSDWENLLNLLAETTNSQHRKLPFRPSKPRTIVLTSGTTGTPKGARRPEPKDWMPAAALTSIFPLRSRKNTIIASPLFHTWALAALQINITLRSTIVLSRKPSPVELIRLAKKHHVHSIFLVPTVLQRIIEDPVASAELPLPELEILAASGSAITPYVVKETLKKFGPVLYNFYGTTEVAWTAIATPSELAKYPATAGKPPLGTKVKILDENYQAVPTGVVGKIFVGNNFVFDGYTNAQNTKETMEGLICTGDLGYFTDEGLLFVGGRADDMIVSGGENVYPIEVENTLSDLPEVRESAVVGVPDEKFGTRLIAYIVKTSPEIPLSENDVKEYIRTKLTRFCVPREVFFLDQLPRNATGKVINRQLPGVQELSS